MPEEEPSEERGRELHEQLFAGDDRAPARIAEVFLPWLKLRMAAIHHAIRDPHLLDSACIDALRSYFKNPRSFRAEELSLGKYLLMAAKGDLRNAVEQKRVTGEREEEIAKKLVELPAPSPEQPSKTDLLEEQVRSLLPDPVDQKVFSLMADGVRETEAYSLLLGIEGRLIDEQRHIVKACKDRILKRLKDAHRRGSLRLPEEGD